ncbi:hypothetical protein, partial [Streptosporangium fragile]|uniref:hypothetical protein n=1 Tax=Streptosporangium fragile TaxID=46186 RepID=UPI0031EC18A2
MIRRILAASAIAGLAVVGPTGTASADSTCCDDPNLSLFGALAAALNLNGGLTIIGLQANVDADAEVEAEADVNVGAGINADVDAEVEAEAEVDADANLDTNVNADLDAAANVNAD